YRILIVSACYSGVFADALADPRTLVITAAAADRPSFGCRDGATWTYFGDAFFNRALRREPRLDAAFTTAKAFVTAREQREGFDPSNPQIAGGAEVLARLGSR
ncbi:MAG: C13 family peptidase, partial [Pseudomonadota bacterium]|nr:C13 family peptidase [Pseudomonadota bacterium]